VAKTTQLSETAHAYLQYNKKGKVMGAVNTFADITELEESLNTTEQLVQYSVTAADNIEDLSGQILKTAENVGVVGTQSAQAAERLGETMEQVMAASQNVSNGAQNLSKLAQETMNNVQGLMQKMNRVNANTSEVNQIVETSNKLAQDASESGKLALKSLGAIREASSDVEKTIGEVNNSVKNVAGLADDISQIAGQINMLALDAIIEAVRASEVGHGFTVVTDSVKQPAGQTAAQAARGGDVKVKEAVNYSQQVAESMEEIGVVTKKLEVAVQESVRYLEDISGVIKQVASVSEESASASDETSASIEEQTASTEEVAVAATKVQEEVVNVIELAKKIVTEVKNFRELWQQRMLNMEETGEAQIGKFTVGDFNHTVLMEQVREVRDAQAVTTVSETAHLR
jgi:methyl-accepting chemotaxis protein